MKQVFLECDVSQGHHFDTDPLRAGLGQKIGLCLGQTSPKQTKSGSEMAQRDSKLAENGPKRPNLAKTSPKLDSPQCICNVD